MTAFQAKNGWLSVSELTEISEANQRKLTRAYSNGARPNAKMGHHHTNYFMTD